MAPTVVDIAGEASDAGGVLRQPDRLVLSEILGKLVYYLLLLILRVAFIDFRGFFLCKPYLRETRHSRALTRTSSGRCAAILR